MNTIERTVTEMLSPTLSREVHWYDLPVIQERKWPFYRTGPLADVELGVDAWNELLHEQAFPLSAIRDRGYKAFTLAASKGGT